MGCSNVPFVYKEDKFESPCKIRVQRKKREKAQAK